MSAFHSDYDTAKYQATRAMYHKVSPTEVRKPTHVWAGQYFSSSMPEAVIRENLDELEKSAAAAASARKRESIPEEDPADLVENGEKQVKRKRNVKLKRYQIFFFPQTAMPMKPHEPPTNETVVGALGFGNSSVFEPLLMGGGYKEGVSGPVATTTSAAIAAVAAAATFGTAGSAAAGGPSSSNHNGVLKSAVVIPGDDLPSVFAKNVSYIYQSRLSSDSTTLNSCPSGFGQVHGPVSPPRDRPRDVRPADRPGSQGDRDTDVRGEEEARLSR